MCRQIHDSVSLNVAVYFHREMNIKIFYHCFTTNDMLRHNGSILDDPVSHIFID